MTAPAKPAGFGRRLPAGLRANLPVSLTSILLIVVFVVATLAAGREAERAFKALQDAIAENGGWFFVLAANGVLAYAIYLMAGRFGRIRIGGEEARPEFSTLTWLAMLFSAGMGIGLVFWAVAEPLHHFSAPPVAPAEGMPRHTLAQQAMGLTFLHWGLHPWAIYCVLAIAIAYAGFNRGLPLTIRSIFHPLIGDRIHGLLGHAIDTTAVLATLFGVATSLGLGAAQISAGLDVAFGTGQALGLKLWLIAGITLVATVSVVSGIGRGIRRLSELNMVLAGLLMVFVFAAGPTLFILNGFGQNIGYYLQNLPRLATWDETFTGGHWQNGWTVFYYAWWLSWSPFVAMFIARISFGRTVREFVLAVLIVPTLVGFAWLTVFGGTALYLELFGSGGMIGTLQTGAENALFALLANFPFPFWTSVLAILIVVTFFVTSSDSASLVVDMIAAGGDPDPPVVQRVFWASMEGVVAAVLLIGGGLTALQTAAICTGLPFAAVLLLVCWALHRWLDEEMRFAA